MSTEILSYDLAKIIRLLPGYDPFAQAGDCWFDEEAAQNAIDFAQECCHHVKGELAGTPLLLEPWQKAVFANLFGWKRPDGTRRYREALIFIPRKNSKALALTTVIPTPTGWTTMGEVQTGDTLFDDLGNQCRVTHVSTVRYDRQCYCVRFSDGTAIIADEDHLWETDSRTDRDRLKGVGGKTSGSKPSIKTTRQILDTLMVCRPSMASKIERNHRIRVAGPIVCDNAMLPVPPYVLGAWLGDGHSDNALLTCSRHDTEIVETIRSEGVAVDFRGCDKRSSANRYLLGSGGRSQDARNKSLHAVLRKMGLIKNKHIPHGYLRASQSQRMALLMGLMDTDGSVTKGGQCVFYSTRHQLACNVLELVRSLGFKPTLYTRTAKLNGKDCGLIYTIQFWAYRDESVFRLTRKAKRLKPRPIKLTRTAWRQIVAVDDVPSVPVRCIQVDSPSSLYLAGEGMVPTHNTTMAAAMVLVVLFTDGEPGAELYSAAAESDQARLCFEVVQNMIRKEPVLKERATLYKYSVVVGDNSYKALSAEAGSKHGFNIHFVVNDELHAHKTPELTDVLMTGTGSRRQPLVVHLSTSDYEREGSICNDKHDYAAKVRDGVIDDPSFLPVIYEASKDDDWTDPTIWSKANPNLGISISEEYLARECGRARDDPGYENTFKRLHLNIRTEAACRWLTTLAWDNCQTEGLRIEDYAGNRCWCGLDVASTDDFTAFVVVFYDGEEMPVFPYFWVPEETARKKELERRIPYSVWARQGYLALTPGPTTPYRQIREDINRIISEHRLGVEEIAADVLFQGLSISQDLTEQDGLPVIEHRQGMLSMATPTKLTKEAILSGVLRHSGHPVLRWMLSNTVVVNDSAGNERPAKDKSEGKIDGVVAMIMGCGRALGGEENSSMYETMEVRRV